MLVVCTVQYTVYCNDPAYCTQRTQCVYAWKIICCPTLNPPIPAPIFFPSTLFFNIFYTFFPFSGVLNFASLFDLPFKMYTVKSMLYADSFDIFAISLTVQKIWGTHFFNCALLCECMWCFPLKSKLSYFWNVIEWALMKINEFFAAESWDTYTVAVLLC